MNRLPLLLLTLVPVLGCPGTPANDDDSAATDGPFGVVALHGPFAGDATLVGLDHAGAPVDATPLGLAGSDWALDGGVGEFFLIGRLGTDVVRRYTFPSFGAPDLEFSVGAGANPQDAVACGGRIYVTRYDVGDNGGGDVAIFDEDGASLGAVDLSAWHEGTDGTPEPTAMVERDGVLYVALQRFDRDAGWVADPVGKVVAINCGEDEVATSWDVRSNSTLRAFGGDIWAVASGGIQRLGAGGFLDEWSDADVGGDPIVAASPGEGGWLVVSEAADGANTVWCLNPSAFAPTELETVDTRAWTSKTDPTGQVWIAFRDHWATADVEPGELVTYGVDPCARVGSVDLGSDPITAAFVELP